MNAPYLLSCIRSLFRSDTSNPVNSVNESQRRSVQPMSDQELACTIREVERSPMSELNRRHAARRPSGWRGNQ